MSKEPIQPQDKYVLRLPDGMRDRIKRVAEANNRSMNAEIVATLEEKYPSPFRHPIGLAFLKMSELSAIHDRDEQEQAVEEANRDLKQVWPGMEYVVITSEESGRRSVQLNWAGHNEEVRAWIDSIPRAPKKPGEQPSRARKGNDSDLI